MSIDKNSLAYRLMKKYDERGWFNDAQKIADDIGYIYSPGKFSDQALSGIDVNSPEYMFSPKTRELVEIKLALAETKLKEKTKNGQLIVIYGLSQMGKDFYATKIEKSCQMQILAQLGISFTENEKKYFNYLCENNSPLIKNLFPIEYAEVYKTRQARFDDKPSLHAVDSESKIPSEFDIRAMFNDSQCCAYSTRGILTKLNNGKIVIVTTTLIDMVEKLKQVAGDRQTTIKIISKKRTDNQIAETERKRYKLRPEAVETEIAKRIKSYNTQYQQYLNFDKYDYSIKNFNIIHNFEDSSHWSAAEQKLEEIEIPVENILKNYFSNSITQKVKK